MTKTCSEFREQNMYAGLKLKVGYCTIYVNALLQMYAPIFGYYSAYGHCVLYIWFLCILYKVILYSIYSHCVYMIGHCILYIWSLCIQIWLFVYSIYSYCVF